MAYMHARPLHNAFAVSLMRQVEPQVDQILFSAKASHNCLHSSVGDIAWVLKDSGLAPARIGMFLQCVPGEKWCIATEYTAFAKGPS